MIPRRSPNGTRYEPFFVFYVPLSSSPVESGVSVGSGVRVFFNITRYRNISVGIELEQVNRTLDTFMAGFVAEWCPDSLRQVGPFAVCPVTISALNAYGGGAPGGLDPGGAGASARGGPAIEYRGDTVFFRAELGAGYEKYASPIATPIIGEIYGGVSIGVDL